MALLALGIRCIAISAEQDARILPSFQQHFPHAIHVQTVEELKGADFIPVLQRRPFTAILLGGGSPCQGNSALNTNRQGWKDPRSQQPNHLQRLHTELRQHMDEHHIHLPVFHFLENVRSTPPDVIAQYTHLAHGPPLAIEASLWGWVSRHRLFWLSCHVQGAGWRNLAIVSKSEMQLPEEFSTSPHTA